MPHYLNSTPEGNIDDLAEELAYAFQHAVRKRTHDTLGINGVFLSGGADSRAMLFGTQQPDKVQCPSGVSRQSPVHC